MLGEDGVVEAPGSLCELVEPVLGVLGQLQARQLLDGLGHGLDRRLDARVPVEADGPVGAGREGMDRCARTI
ncbi:MAG TPA: hypothetical protein QGF58_28280 [Myxococcota bacterium]|nr:hypothetical protein [Myxococcota bacterium]